MFPTLLPLLVNRESCVI